MPALTPDAAALPRTFRPKWARRIIFPTAAVMLIGFLVLAVVLPGGEDGYQAGDRTGVFLVGVAISGIMFRLANVRIRCAPEGVLVHNPIRSRSLDWAEILSVRLPQNAPWVVLDLSDGTEMPAIAIQGSDGEHARRDARALADLVDAHTPTGGPDGR